ncbi:MAG: hypothetical protein ACI4AM_04860 [Muribaculaceae bacterium]
MNIKQFLLWLLAFVMSVPATCAQTADYEAFKRDVVMSNASCPIDQSPLGYIASIEILESRHALIFTTMITSPMITYEAISPQYDSMKQSISQMFGLDQMRPLLEPCVKFKLAFIYRFKWQTGQSLDFEYSVKELTAIFNADADQAQVMRDVVEQMIVRENDRCPVETENGVTEQSVYRFEENIYYEFIVDEDKFNLEDLITNNELFRQTLAESFKQPGMIVTIRNIYTCGYNLVFLYVGSASGRVCELKFTNEELEQIIQ